MKYKLIVSDIDGVWTDGSFYYSREGDAMRRFTTRDSYGVRLCQLNSLPILVLSTEKNPMVEKRMEKLHIKHVRLGIRNKLKSLAGYCEQHGIDLSEVAFIGDDMNDFHLIGQVGFFACPADAYPRIKQEADLVLETRGGEGAFREFVENLLGQEGLLDQTYQKYIAACLEK